MASREFTDETGIVWRVWRTVPGGAKVLDDAYAHGWLTFESEQARRRLVPVPADWATAPDERLAAYCRKALEVPRLMGAFRSATDAARDAARDVAGDAAARRESRER